MKSGRKTRTTIIFVCLIIGVTIVLVFNKIAMFLFPENVDRNGELIKLILSIIGGFCLLRGLYISNRRAKATEESVKIQGDQINLSLKSQIDDRFKNAIEHLGDTKEPIIMGGIAELHQIAKEDSNKYAEVVFNILCSYIRTETNIYKKTAADINATIVNTIIHYLFKNTPENPYKYFAADLSASNLANQDILNCDLKWANLSFSYLHTVENSSLDNADLSKANISGSSFKNNSLHDAKLSRTNISHVEFESMSFLELKKYEHELFSPCCTDCRFNNVNFDNIHFFGAVFISCIFDNCHFTNADIMNSTFYACKFINISLASAKTLSKINFNASAFNNFTIGSYIGQSEFKGCYLTSDVSRYHFLEEELSKVADITSSEDTLNLSITLQYQCVFGKLTDVDAEEIRNKYEDLTKCEKFPIGKGN